MKRPSAASLKRVNAENLTRLGAERLAEILLEVADTRVDLKRRLRMELAAEQGAAHLLPEIDRRLALLSGSRGAVTWRQRAAFVRDLDGLRGLIAGRLAGLDLAAAQARIVEFLALFPQAMRRVRDREGAVAAVFDQAAADAVTLLARAEGREGAARLAEAIAAQPVAWGRWSGGAFAAASRDVAALTLGFLAGREGPAFTSVLRRLADVAGDARAYEATFTREALRSPAAAADVASRHLRAGDPEAARALLEAAINPQLMRRSESGVAAPDFAWEGAWIDYLEAVGRVAEAQAARWASFERTLSADRARAFTRRLPDFEDVEAEARIFDLARTFPDAGRGLELLTSWPALREAAELIAARGAELRPDPEQAEAWGRLLRRRFPAAAEALLRRGAAEAFRRREFSTSARLTEEADALAA